MKIYSIFNTLPSLFIYFYFRLPSPSVRSVLFGAIALSWLVGKVFWKWSRSINRLSQSMNFQCKLISREFMNTLSWRWKAKAINSGGEKKGDTAKIVSRLFSSSDSSSTFLWPKVYTIRSSAFVLFFFFLAALSSASRHECEMNNVWA